MKHRNLTHLPTVLLLTIVCLFVVEAGADPAKGQQLFVEKNCADCHQMEGPSLAVPIAGRAGIKGPPLWFAGSKFKAGWMQQWLAQPTPIRRVRYNTLKIAANEHPALTADEAAAVAAYLETRVDAELKGGQVANEPLNRRAQFNAEKLFAKKQVCFGCHQYPAKSGPIGGYTGPSLVGAGERLRMDWIYFFLQDNTRYYPNGRMPVYGDQAFDPFTEDEMKVLTQYIGNM